MQKLAIIGGGISGLCLAHQVQESYDITLFESQDYLGGNNCSTEVEGGHRLPMGVIIYPARQLFENTMHFIWVGCYINHVPKAEAQCKEFHQGRIRRSKQLPSQHDMGLYVSRGTRFQIG